MKVESAPASRTISIMELKADALTKVKQRWSVPEWMFGHRPDVVLD